MTEKAKTTSTPSPNLKLRYERERRAWSQQQLADELGTTPLNISRWERGITLPGPHLRGKLCELFAMTAQQLGLLAEKDADQPAQPVAQPAAPVSKAAEPHALWNVAYRRNPFFTGREDILAQVRDAFTSGDAQSIALAQPQAISGLGGIGKTQTAVEYAYRYREQYDAVFWVRADSYDLLVSDFVLIAHLLTLPQRNEQEQDKIVQAVIHWLDTHSGWLLILDNADDLNIVRDFMPTAGKGHVILTTRAQATGTMAQRIEMEKMSLEEGTLFLLQRIKRIKHGATLQSVNEILRQQAQAIVEVMDGLPLALDQAGAYIEETNCNLTDYLKFYKTRRNRLLRTRGRDATGHPEPVATTWSLSFEKVEHANPAAAELLKLCAFLHPDAIPESMIMEGAAELGPVLGPIVVDELDFNEAIGELHKYSLIKRDTEEKIINIHRLVQVVVRDGMTKEEERKWVNYSVKMMGSVFPMAEFAMWAKCQQYLPQAQTCIVFIEQWGIELSEAVQLFLNVGDYLRERGQYGKTEACYQSVLIIREKILGSEHPDVGIILSRIGRLYREQGKYNQAEPLILKALEILEKAFGLEHIEVAFVLGNLAELYRLQSKFTEAESLYLRSLAIQEQQLGAGHVDVAESTNNLALFYHYRGNLMQAEPLYVRALNVYENALGANHPEVATTLNNLAALYDEQGKDQEAESLLLRSIAIREQSLGLDHPYLAYSLNNLGALYHDNGEYTKAEPLLLRALTIREQALGPIHPLVAASLARLAALFMNQGKYVEAEKLFLRALTIREQVLGPYHPDVARGLSRLTELYTLQGRYDQATLFLQRALDIYDKMPDLVHPDIAITFKKFAAIYRSQHQYERAVSLYKRALALEEQGFGAEHLNVAATLIDYADLLQEMGQSFEAAAAEARAQAIRARAE